MNMSLVQVAAAIIYQNDQVLIAQRPSNKHKGGYWEFPGGKVEPLETAEQALGRELQEELDIIVHDEGVSPFSQVEFKYPEKSVLLHFFWVRSFKGEPKGMEGQPIRWVPFEHLEQYEFPEANLPVVKKLQLFRSNI